MTHNPLPTVCDVTNYPLFARRWILHSQMHDIAFRFIIRRSPVATLMQSCTCAHVLTCIYLCCGEYISLLNTLIANLTQILRLKSGQ